MEDKRYINQIEVLINIFTLDKNKLKVLLIKRTEEPFKGYWMIPSNLLMTTETIEECAKATAIEFLGCDDIYFTQCNIFSKIDRLPNERTLANSLIGIIDNNKLLLKKQSTPYEKVWFPIDEIPKMIFDHAEILKDATEFLKKQLNNIDVLKMLLPGDFTMPEFQNLYEQILNKKLDRRNFSKKILKTDLLYDTGFKTSSRSGRPARLYRFKESEDLWRVYE